MVNWEVLNTDPFTVGSEVSSCQMDLKVFCIVGFLKLQ